MRATPILRAVSAYAARHALLVVLLFAALAGGGVLEARHGLGVTTNTDDLFSNKLHWKQREQHYDRLFPQFNNLLVAVIDARIPEEADATATALARALESDHTDFHSVRRPDALPFFATDGLLFLDRKPLTDFLDQLIDAQPFLGQLNADPSARGLFSALSLVALGAAHGQSLAAFSKPLDGFGRALEAIAAGDDQPMSWQTLLGGSLAEKAGRFRFVLAQPVLDYNSIAPGGRATAAIRAVAANLPFVRSGEARVRITGSVALSDDEFASVAKGALTGLIGSLLLVMLWLFLALRSWRLIVPVALTLLLGLILTTSFAALAVGTLNLISVAFAILFVGIAVDFAIQFTVRFREFSIGARDRADAIDRTCAHVGRQIAIAAVATASGFLAFTPTAFVGVAELGLIAGVGMLIAFTCTLTFLPACLVLFRPSMELREVGFRQLKRADILFGQLRLPIVVLCGLLLAGGIVATTKLRFDADPLHTKDPNTESMRTLADLVRNPLTTPYTVNTLVPSFASAATLGAKLATLPMVAQVTSLASFVPDDQAAKLALIADASSLLSPTLDAPPTAVAPTTADLRMAIRSTLAQIRSVSNGLKPGDPLLAIGDALSRLSTANDDALTRMNGALTRFLPTELGRLRDALGAAPVTEANLPDTLKRDWVASDGQYRVEATERIKGFGQPAELDRFVREVRAVDPEAGGSVVTIVSTSRTILRAFRHAALYAIVAICVILTLSTRRLVDAAAIVASLLLSAALTVIVSVLLPLPLNFANIIALPLLLGVGVSFNIYFVMNWRAGETSRLASPTARAVIFSALTTGTAFGSLALSHHPGTASMGKLLLISLGGTLFGSLVFIPALLAMLSRSQMPHVSPATEIETESLP